MALGAVSDVWFVILYTRARPEYAELQICSLPLWLALTAGLVVAIGLFAYGASLNDLLDARHDSAFSPQRPIPAGRIRGGQVVVMAISALMVAILFSIIMGEAALILTLMTATGILFYNAAGKHVPAIGLLTIGLVHAVHMMIPNHSLEFTIPVWLIMTHAMGIGIAVHILDNKRPMLNAKSVVILVLGWVASSALVLGYGWISAEDGRFWPMATGIRGIAWPLLAVMGFFMVVYWKSTRSSGRNLGEKLQRYGAMWQCLYGAAWLLAVDLGRQALLLFVVAISGFIVMTLIKEVYGHGTREISYRG